MSDTTINTSRRSFFMKGGAALGATVACAGAGAATLLDGSASLQEQISELHLKLSGLEDQEALRQLHLAFTSLLDQQALDAAGDLFTDDALVSLHGELFRGKQQLQLLADNYRSGQVARINSAHRIPTQLQDSISVSSDRQHARGSFHQDVKVSTPLTAKSSIADMARQQGMHAQDEWQAGRYDVDFSRIDDQWRIQALHYQQV